MSLLNQKSGRWREGQWMKTPRKNLREQSRLLLTAAVSQKYNFVLTNFPTSLLPTSINTTLRHFFRSWRNRPTTLG
jgi:hypothetical protein